jgi:hypothetical protein
LEREIVVSRILIKIMKYITETVEPLEEPFDSDAVHLRVVISLNKESNLFSIDNKRNSRYSRKETLLPFRLKELSMINILEH